MSDKDILSPPIQIMGERRYRVNVITDDYSGPCANLFKNNSATTGSTGYREPDLYDDDEDDEEYEVEELGNSIFKTTFHVPRVFYGGLIGFKGSTKRRIETESKTEITIPGVRDSGTIVSVKGKLRKDVCGGRRRIELLCESLRRNTNPTHFACVPACTPEMQKSFNEFKQSVLAEKYPGIDERLFISTEKIHITLATCTLLDDEERIKAAQIFTECKELVTNTGPIEVIVQGLEIMNDDSSMVSVLYGRVVAPALQEIGEKVLQKYRDAGFNNDQNDRVKLHMTVMNARYRNEVDVNSLGKFDARHLLRKFGDYKFGQFQITELHLSQMHTTAENGFYVATGIINV